MRKFNYNRVLFLSNLGVDNNDPNFRVGSYKNYLLPLAKEVSNNAKAEIKILANSHVGAAIRDHLPKFGIMLSDLHLFDHDDGESECFVNFMTRSYAQAFSPTEEKSLFNKIDDTLNGWQPDAIICWEAPTIIFRLMYPEALVLDLMPSMFMRPPYPRMISVDPKGLYKDCWYSEVDVRLLSAQDSALHALDKLRKKYIDHFEKIGSRQFTIEQTGINGTDCASLIPLQISDYFGWKYNCKYNNQIEYLKDTLNTNKFCENFIVTQYTGNLIQETIIDNDSQYHFLNRHPNLVYNENFSKIDSISQYLLPNVNTVHSISSTLGIQAKFFNKKLVSPSQSHLSYIADAIDLKESENCQNKNLDSFLANYLFRTCILWERVLNENGYFSSFLNTLFENRSNIGIDRFPRFNLDEVNSDQVWQASKTSSSERNFAKVHTPEKIPTELGIEYYKEIISSSKHKIISFDVFDTLVCRNVLKPTDVFTLIAAHLTKFHADTFDDNFLERFADYRSGVEKKLRHNLDSNQADGVDELTILSVYEELLTQNDLPVSLAKKLVEIEQKIELKCIRPRAIGLELYNYARQIHKPIVLVSDFIHPTEFVIKVLRSNDFEGWDKIYVSSEWRQKKHSGKLFDIVCADLNILPSKIAHFGDNPHGDVKMAEKLGISAYFLKSGPSILKDALIERNININAVEKSIVTGAILCGHANQHLGANGTRRKDNNVPELINGPKEFGFLTVGPLMHFFCSWVLQQSLDHKVRQILFFARDSRLPFQMTRELIFNKKLKQLNVCYLPVSRAALNGVDIFSPRDLRNIRIDDFNKKASITDLFQKRFMLESREISKTTVKQWTDEELSDLTVGALPQGAIYEIAIESARENWKTIEKRLQRKRDLFIRALEYWGVDTSLPTIAVDFGYKGTIYKKLRPFFFGAFLPRFFMSFSSPLGREPVNNLEVFYLKNIAPQLKTEHPFLKYNLILETLINDGTGSATGYDLTERNTVKVNRDESVTRQHSEKIEQIHSGAREFFHYWTQHCQIIDEFARWEPNMISYLFASVMTSPTQQEASILSGLVFDNGYSGHDTRSIINQGSARGRTFSSVWPEGEKSLTTSPNITQYKSWRLIYSPIVKYFIGIIGTRTDVQEFERNPRQFFRNVKERHYRIIGWLLYP